MAKDDEDSTLTVITEKQDTRSEFDKDFEKDTLYQLQNRMLAKAKTKQFTPEDFVEKAKQDYDEQDKIVSDATEFPDTPEPDEEEQTFFF